MIGEVDEAVFGEARMNDDVHHPLKAGDMDLWSTGHRTGIQHALSNDS